MTTPPDIRLQLTSDPLYLAGAREMVAAVARRLGFTEEACGQIALAVDEALCNVIRHGYDRQRDRPIWINLWPLPDPDAASARPGLRITIEDEARQIDPEQIKGRDLDHVRPGGLGVHIIREVMDSVSYEKRQGKGMRLTLVKYRAAKDAPKAGPPCGQGGQEGCCGA